MNELTDLITKLYTQVRTNPITVHGGQISQVNTIPSMLSTTLTETDDTPHNIFVSEKRPNIQPYVSNTPAYLNFDPTSIPPRSDKINTNNISEPPNISYPLPKTRSDLDSILKPRQLYKDFTPINTSNIPEQKSIPEPPEIRSPQKFDFPKSILSTMKVLPVFRKNISTDPTSITFSKAKNTSPGIKSVPSNGYSVVVSLSDKSVILLKNNEVVNTFPALVGDKDFPTPKGMFKVLKKQSTTKRESSYMGPAWIEFAGRGDWIFGLHGRGTEHDPDSTHGCVALVDADAAMLFNLLNKSDPVNVIEDSYDVHKTKYNPPNMKMNIPMAQMIRPIK